jgi:hypothetical protein
MKTSRPDRIAASIAPVLFVSASDEEPGLERLERDELLHLDRHFGSVSTRVPYLPRLFSTQHLWALRLTGPEMSRQPLRPPLRPPAFSSLHLFIRS